MKVPEFHPSSSLRHPQPLEQCLACGRCLWSEREPNKNKILSLTTLISFPQLFQGKGITPLPNLPEQKLRLEEAKVTELRAKPVWPLPRLSFSLTWDASPEKPDDLK